MQTDTNIEVLKDKHDIKVTFDTLKGSRFDNPYPSLRDRIQSLKNLKKNIKTYEDEILLALKEDFHKPNFEGYVTEISLVYQEIDHNIKHLKDWMRIKKVKRPLYLLPSRAYYKHYPKGVVLILGPWNYPFLLIMDPLVNALAAGNRVMTKLPLQTPKTSLVMKKILQETFNANEVLPFFMNDEEIIPNLIHAHRFDHIFFTGSQRVGKFIMEAGAKSLTPVTLELGGKSPCIVEESANIKLAAKKIAWAKMINAGQTCVAPDYILVDEKIKNSFLTELIKNFDVIHKTKNPSDYAHIINDRHLKGLKDLLEERKIEYGGTVDKDSKYFQPTIIEVNKNEDPLMNREIFGPILPIISFDDFEEVRSIVEQNANPLALYIFSKNNKRIRQTLDHVSFGGACVNDCLLHLGVSDLPFGGIGQSGMGSYHGWFGFNTFSHKKSVVKSSSWFDIPIKYAPYTTSKFNWIKRFLKL